MSGITQMLLAASSSEKVSLVSRLRSQRSVDPADAHVGVRYYSTGEEYYVDGTSLSWVDTGHKWLLSGSAADYWIRATVTSGTNPSGSALGSWLQLSTTRDWYHSQTAVGFKEASLTVEIATDSSGVDIIDTCTVDLFAEVT